jgi:hypothetical protein
LLRLATDSPPTVAVVEDLIAVLAVVRGGVTLPYDHSEGTVLQPGDRLVYVASSAGTPGAVPPHQ